MTLVSNPSMPDTSARSNNDLTQHDLRTVLSRLAREASVEINVQDAKHLTASRQFLLPQQKIFISHLPGQSWEATEAVCQQVRNAGYDPVPHLPVRLLDSSKTLEKVLSGFVRTAGAREILLLAGDYPQARGPYSSVADVLATGVIAHSGLTRLSVAGHPEGHPKVGLDEIRRAERDKALWGQQAGMPLSFVTQFFFEPEPFLAWANEIRAHAASPRLVAGIAGPAGLTTLFKFAMRCGVGPSIRALGIRPTSLTQLLGDHNPDKLTAILAQALLGGRTEFNGLHLFCFGGFLRTCEWLHQLAGGERPLALDP